MNIKSIDFKHLKTIITLAELQDLNATSYKLKLTSATIKFHLSTIESVLGCKLFIRIDNVFETTFLGRRVVSDARKIIEKSSVFHKGEFNSLKKNILKVGISTGNESITQLGLIRMDNKYPDNEAIIQLMDSNEAFGKIKKREIAICFVRPPIPKELVSIKVSHDHLTIGVNDAVFNNFHGDFTSNNILNLLSATPLVRLKNNPNIQMTNIINRWIKTLNISLSRTIYVNTTLGFISSILSGGGFGFFIKSKNSLNIPGMNYIPLFGKDTEWDVEMAWNPSENDKLRDCFVEGYRIDK